MKKTFLPILVLTLPFIFLSETVLSKPSKDSISWPDIYYKKAEIAKGWKFIVIHHSATGSGSAASFHNYHSDQGYGGLSYHFVIGNGKGSPDGKVEEGFRWKEQMAGTHVNVESWYHNIFGIGICLVGNFDKSPPTKNQISALSKLIQSLCKKYDIPNKNVMGHCEIPLSRIEWDTEGIEVFYNGKKTARTKCPGKYFPDKKVLFSKVRLPASLKSQNVIRRVSPLLKKDLEKVDLEYGAPVFIRIFKKEKILELWMKQNRRFRLFKSYPICTYGPQGLGPKLKQGDNIAPEGFYYVGPNFLNPYSKYHLSLNIGYPNKYDRFHKRTGGNLMIHGECVSIGCYAMTNESIEEIYTLSAAALKKGQPFFRVHIFPFKMTAKNMKFYNPSKWSYFWKNLKDGYDFFHQNDHVPPDVDVKQGKYVFKKI